VLRKLREKRIKTAARRVRHSRHAAFQMAEVAVPVALSQQILERINRFRASPEDARAR
jgi:hypothetical protein